jgi:hypothetical protein
MLHDTKTGHVAEITLKLQQALAVALMKQIKNAATMSIIQSSKHSVHK